MTTIRLFRRRFLSKSPALYYWCVCLHVVRVYGACVHREMCVCFVLHRRLLHITFGGMSWTCAASLYRLCAVYTPKVLNVVKSIGSCFCLFIYINIFLHSALYDDSLSLFRLFTHLFFSKRTKQINKFVSCLHSMQSQVGQKLAERSEREWKKSQRRNLYQSMCSFSCAFFKLILSISSSVGRFVQNKSKSIRINGNAKSHKDMTT